VLLNFFVAHEARYGHDILMIKSWGVLDIDEDGNQFCAGHLLAPMFVIEVITGDAYSVNKRGRLSSPKEQILTNIPGTDIGRRMGRPALGVKETKVRLTEEQRERIRVLVGEQGMAGFIREAIERELKRREKLER
jgi:hypothetical protein